MQERRRHIRLLSPILINFPSPGTMKTERSFTQDVSESGMRFPTAAKLQMGQEVPLTLQMPFNNTALQCTGLVMWIREISRMGSPQYDVGVRFRWIEDRDKQKLTRHLATLLDHRVAT